MAGSRPADFSFTPAPLGSVFPRGWFEREFVVQKNGLTGHIDEIWEDLGASSGWRGGPGENWERGPYYLDGLIPLAYALDDDALKQKAQPWIEWMLKSQREDGFFGPADNLDWWPRIVALKALMQYGEATGDARVPALMDRYFRYQLDRLPKQPLAMWAAARGQEQLLPMLWLYRKTGADDLPELARLLREQTYRWGERFARFPYQKRTHAYLNRPLFMAVKRATLISDWTAKRLKKYRRAAPKPQTKKQIDKANASKFLHIYHETHSVNLAMALKMPALDGLWRGAADGAAASRAGLDALTRFHGLASGLFSGDEHLNGRSPTVGAELCLCAEYLYSLQILLAVTGDVDYADKLEQVAWNAWPAMFTPDMCAHQYVQQVNQIEVSRQKRDWYDAYDEANLFGLAPNFGCCAANMHQGWPKLLGALFMAHPDGVAAPVYAPCSARVDIHGTAVRFTETTNYPFDGAITIAVDEIETADRAMAFTLLLRVPGWAETFELRLNKNPQPLEPENGYLRLKRLFRAGDRISLRFPMPLRLHPEPAGGVTLRRGPLLLALPVEARRRVLHGREPFADYELLPRGKWRYAVAKTELPDAQITLNEPGEHPFGGDTPPLTVQLRLAPAPQWQTRRHSAGPVPPPFSAAPDALEEKTLVPYGCTRLRIAQFPIATIDSADKELR
ncbi:MAG: hypothetical protein GX417_13325 [Clostridiales bacterium]|nr:hypothetical protein [Clostridiales bacterium]